MVNAQIDGMRMIDADEWEGRKGCTGVASGHPKYGKVQRCLTLT